MQQFGRLYNSARVRNSLWSQPGVRPVVMCIVLHFSDAATANFPVAGIPAAARAVHQIALAAEEGRHIGRCIVAVPGGWVPNEWCQEEMARLAPQFDVLFEDFDGIRAAAGTLYLKGEDLLPARTIASLLQRPTELPPAALRVTPSLAGVLDDLRRKGDAIITATAKASDGIVSRHFNRPISRLISRMLLRVRGVKPVHATIAAAITGVAMAASLFVGGEGGLVFGAVLYQLASIIDGVDGEIARATYRSSRTGAMLDSLTDATTNLAFFAGVSFNLWRGGQHLEAAAGATGLVLLSAGLIVIGRQAKRSGGSFTFNAIKDHFATTPSAFKQWLTWLTMRDFYAAAAALLVICGYGAEMIVLFAAAVAVWLAVSITVLTRAATSSKAVCLNDGASDGVTS